MPEDDFQRAYVQLKLEEKGFTKDPNDRGNWTSGIVGKGELKGTNCGISAAQYPDLDIEHLNAEEIAHIYLTDYWMRLRGDHLSWPVNLYLFDDAVNSGQGNAVHTLQRTLGVYPDGIIGPQTIEAANRMTSERLADFLAKRIFEETLFPTWPIYGEGWAKRIVLLAQSAIGGSNG